MMVALEISKQPPYLASIHSGENETINRMKKNSRNRGGGKEEREKEDRQTNKQGK